MNFMIKSLRSRSLITQDIRGGAGRQYYKFLLRVGEVEINNHIVINRRRGLTGFLRYLTIARERTKFVSETSHIFNERPQITHFNKISICNSGLF